MLVLRYKRDTEEKSRWYVNKARVLYINLEIMLSEEFTISSANCGNQD